MSGTGQEAVHLRYGTTHSKLQYSRLHDTGLINPQYGEGIYIGR